MADYYGTADIDAVLAEIGLAVRYGDTTSQALLDTPQSVVLDDAGHTGVIGQRVLLSIRTGSLPGITIGSALWFDDRVWYARKILEIDDGALTEIECSIAAPSEADPQDPPLDYLTREEVEALVAALRPQPPFPIDSSGFDGGTTSFAGLIPFIPDLDSYDLIIFESGYSSPLRRVAANPQLGEFALSGATMRDITFGRAPESDHEAYGVPIYP